MTSCNALVYEAIQRVYRNAVVDRIRSGMQAAYPDDYENRVTSPFPSWDDIVSAAGKSAVTGVVAHPHQDVFDYLDVSHFPVLLNNYFKVLAPVEDLPPEHVDQLKRQVLSYAREIKTVRDPLSHPGSSDIGAFDALRALDNASRALRVLGLPEAAEKIEPLLREVAAKAFAANERDSTGAAGLLTAPAAPRQADVADRIGVGQEPLIREVLEFRNRDDDYLAWVAAHPGGYVLNTGPQGGDARLHRATCGTISKTPPFTSGSYIKVCSAAPGHLDQWMASRRGTAAERCRLCLPPGAPLPGRDGYAAAEPTAGFVAATGATRRDVARSTAKHFAELSFHWGRTKRATNGGFIDGSVAISRADTGPSFSYGEVFSPEFQWEVRILQEAAILRRGGHSFDGHVDQTRDSYLVYGNITEGSNCPSFIGIEIHTFGAVSIYFREYTTEATLDEVIGWWVYGAWQLGLIAHALLGTRGPAHAAVIVDLANICDLTAPEYGSLVTSEQGPFSLLSDRTQDWGPPYERWRDPAMNAAEAEIASVRDDIRRTIKTWRLVSGHAESESTDEEGSWTPWEVRKRLGLGRPRR